MRLKNKKHKHFSRTDNKKYQEQNHKKEKTNNNNTIIVAIFIAFASTIQFSHNTPPHTQHPTTCDPKTRATTSKKVLLKFRGDFIEQQPCCSRHPTACHKTKQTRTQTHLLLCKTLYNQQGLKDRKKFLFHQLPKPHTRSMCGTCLHLKTKTCHHQAPNSTMQ